MLLNIYICRCAVLRHRLLAAKCTLADSYSRAAHASRALRQWQHALQPADHANSLSSQNQSNVKQLILQFSLPKQGFTSSQQSPPVAVQHSHTKSRFNATLRQAEQEQPVLPALAIANNTSVAQLEASDAQPAEVIDASLTQGTFASSCIIALQLSVARHNLHVEQKHIVLQCVTSLFTAILCYML